MNSINNFGERLWAGNMGNAFVVLSFVGALLSFFSFYLASKNADFKKLARFSFNLHSFAVLGIIGTLFFMLFTRAFFLFLNFSLYKKEK